MHQDFQAQDFRGHSFKGQDLTGANFARANIQGADFTNTVLIEANFSHAQAGLQRFWLLALTAITAILATLTGLILGYGGAFPSFVNHLLAENSNSVGKESLLLFGFLVLVTFFSILIYRGIGAALGVFIVSIAATTAVISFVGAGDSALIAAAVVQAVIVAIVVAGIFIGALTLTAAVVINKTLLPALVGICALAGTVCGVLEGIKGTADGNRVANLAMSGILAAVLLALSIYIAYRVIGGDKKYAVIHTLAINLCAIGGTSFRNANLTDADFSQASLIHTDFRKANLTRTCWFLANKLDLSRIEDTYLDNLALRQLVISKSGRNHVYDRQNLRNLNLEKADLEGASFIGSDLSEANLQNANLTHSKLVDTQLYRAKLVNSCLTGACIQNWGISTETQLDAIKCNYVYMRLLPEGRGVDRRKPDNDQETFESDEFSAFIAPFIKTLSLYQNQYTDPSKILKINSLDFRHHKNDDHKAIIFALTKLAAKHPELVFEVVSVYSVDQNMMNVGVAVTSGIETTTLSSQYKKYFKQYSHLSEQEKQETFRAGDEEQIEKMKRLLSAVCESPSSYIGASIQIVIDKSQKIDFAGAQNVSVGNINQVAADRISNAFNTVAQSSAPQDLKAELEKLNQAVAEMVKLLPEEKQREVAQDLKTLTDEATSSSPRKKWYELSAEGLIEAAKAVGEAATPVITAAKTVLTLLAV